MLATVPGMGRKKSSAERTDTIRVDAEIVRMINVIATVEGKSINAICAPILRPVIKRMWLAAVDKLNKQREGQAE